MALYARPSQVRVLSYRIGPHPTTAPAAPAGTLPPPRRTTQWSKAVAPAPHLRYVRGVEMDWADIEGAVSSLGLSWSYATHKPHDPRPQLQTSQFEVHHSGGHTLVQGKSGWQRASLDAVFLRLRSRVAIRSGVLPPLARAEPSPEPERA